MIDPKFNVVLANVYPDLVDRYKRGAIAFSEEVDLQIRPTEGLRSMATQYEYFSQGRQKQDNGTWKVVRKSKVITWALPGLSDHNYGLAIDSCFRGLDPYLKNSSEQDVIWNMFGECMEREGLMWGGRFKDGKVDRPHVFYKYGLTLREIQNLYEKGGVLSVWSKIDSIRNCGGELV